jgi:transposase
MKYKTYQPNQMWLIPPSIEEEIPENDIVRVFSKVIDELDIKAFNEKYKEEGNVAYHPKLMLKVILYSYQQGLFSSRKIEQACRRNIYYWYLTGKEVPNFRTLCKFIKRHQEAIEDVFSQVLWVCHREGLVDLDTVAVDGSVVKANASKAATWDEKRIQSELKSLRKKATEYLQKHIESDELEGCLEAEVRDFGKGTSPSKERVNRLLKEVQNVKDIERQLKSSGQKRLNTTDEDAYLNGKAGHPKAMSYNAHILVEKSHQVIVSSELDNRPGEHHMVPVHIDNVSRVFDQTPTYLLGDSAYANQPTIHYLNQKSIQPVCPQFQIKHYRTHQKPNRNAVGCFPSTMFYPLSDERYLLCPAKQLLKQGSLYQDTQKQMPYYQYTNPTACRGCPIKSHCTTRPYRKVKRGLYAREIEQVETYLHSPEGQAKYRERIGIVEPVFANIKWNKSFKLSFRGLSLAKTQFKLACLMHNIEKLAKARGYSLNPFSFYGDFRGGNGFMHRLIASLRLFFNQNISSMRLSLFF